MVDSIVECDFCHFSQATLDPLIVSAVFNSLWPASQARSCVLKVIAKLAYEVIIDGLWHYTYT